MSEIAFDAKFARCPSCNQAMERGFSPRNMGLSWITAEAMSHVVFRDEDLTGSGLKKLLPARAEYDLTYHCAACRVYVVDYSRAVSSEEAKALAKATLAEAPSSEGS